MNKTILFFITKAISPYPRLEKEAKALNQKGYNINVVAWDREGNQQVEENSRGYKVINFKLKAPYGKFVLFFYLFYWWLFQIKHLIRDNYDIIHTFNFDTLIPSVIFGKIRGKKIVYDVADFYADMLPNGTPQLVRTIISFLEIRFALFCDLVILADESRRKQFKNKLHNYISVYNVPEMPKIPKKKGNKEFTIFYGGVLYENRGLVKITQAVEGLSNVDLIIAGYGGDKDRLLRLFEKYPNIYFKGKITHQEILNYTSNADLLFALFDPEVPNHKFSSPNKLFEAMACGIPIIVNKNTGMDKIVEQEGCGVVVDYNNIEELRNTIIKLKKNKRLRSFLGKNGKRAYSQKYNWATMKRKLLENYKII